MLLFFLLSAALVATDQITKALAVAYLKPVTTVPIIRDVLHLTYRENTGAAFSILNGFRWGFVILAVIVCGIVIYINVSRKIDSKLFYASSILVVAGAIGNVIDRIATGAVVDFIDFRLIDFPVFNFADICLTVGVAMLFIYFLFFYGKEKKTVKTEETPDEDNGN
ncbi:MAG: signal peptidase II [Clostridia bacterium]|nr:signal peptidase II [Clostridia bacterium]